MKNLVNSALAVSLMLLVSLSMSAFDTRDDEPTSSTPQKIVIVRTETGINLHRSILLPFDMYYQSGTVFVEFYENIGLVSAAITNVDTGETWNAVLDSSEVFSFINVITDSWEGSYELMIVDGRGNSYSGWFELQ